MAVIFILLLFIRAYSCENVEQIFKTINEITVKFNALGADIAWQSSINPANDELPSMAAEYQKKKIAWQHNECKRLGKLHNERVLNETEERQAYLLCRGPRYTYNEARKMSDLYEELQSIYSNASICIPHTYTTDNITVIEDAIAEYIANIQKYLKSKEDSIYFAVKLAVNNFKSGICLKGEEDFERAMENTRNPKVLEFIWLSWREGMKPMKNIYRQFVDIENKAAKRNGYADIGMSWREDLEIPNLRELSRRLCNEIKPLYKLLHGVVRFSLRRVYGDSVSERGPIPAHLLGNLWSQNWEALIDIIMPHVVNLDDRIKELNWTAKDMVKKADDFYVSMGLPAMTPKFWRESIFSRENKTVARCHGTAADMFQDGDFRLLYCSGVSFQDFYVIHHELGHLQYYMAYEKQPGLFRQANAALHETVGDAIMYAVMTPQHLNRLRLINDMELYNQEINEPTEDKQSQESNKNYIKKDYNIVKLKDKKIDNDFENKLTTDNMIILKQALSKLPQIPFSLLIDEYRWRFFEGSLDPDRLNEEFWLMAQELQGIAPSRRRGEEYFDVGAKFHVPDNTPYIRYFLSSFLQHQIFEGLCRAAVFGHRNIKSPLPTSIKLNRCDIYGSKSAGRILQDLMSCGHSQHWRQMLQESIGINDISANALKRYYRPLYALLIKLVKKYNIPVGW